MEFKPSDEYSETSPLIEPVDFENDRDLFMIPLKRPSPKLPPARYRNVRPRSPSKFPTMSSPPSNPEKSPQPEPHLAANNYQSSPMSGCTIKPDSPPMFTSPLMSPESGVLGIDGILNGQIMGAPGSLIYNSPPMSGRNSGLGSSPVMSSEAAPAQQSPETIQPSTRGDSTSASRSTGDKINPSTKASSIENSPPVVVEQKLELETGEQNQVAPEIPPLSAARNNKHPSNLGLALKLPPSESNNNTSSRDLLAPPGPKSPHSSHYLQVPRSPRTPRSPGRKTATTGWTVPDSPLERLSQMRATPDSAYDRARQMEVRRSEWKHVVYRFPVRGAEHWVIDADLTESSHARLADVARRSSDGFEWNGDYELANIYRVLAAAHARVMEEMRAERRGVRA
ncbi:hypothetical protein VTI28DRAFT_6731 [Corynascus sepedonium]